MMSARPNVPRCRTPLTAMGCWPIFAAGMYSAVLVRNAEKRRDMKNGRTRIRTEDDSRMQGKLITPAHRRDEPHF